MHGQFGQLSPGKASSHYSTALRSFFFFLSFLFAMFSCFHTTSCDAYSCTTDGQMICNARTHLGACRTHKGGGGGGGGVRHEYVCTRDDYEGQKKKNCRSHFISFIYCLFEHRDRTQGHRILKHRPCNHWATLPADPRLRPLGHVDCRLPPQTTGPRPLPTSAVDHWATPTADRRRRPLGHAPCRPPQ